MGVLRAIGWWRFNGAVLTLLGIHWFLRGIREDHAIATIGGCGWIVWSVSVMVGGSPEGRWPAVTRIGMGMALAFSAYFIASGSQLG